MTLVARAALALLVSFVALQGRSASAVTLGINTMFSFSGSCTDCSQRAGTPVTTRAELTLFNYTLGSAITRDNFVSFHYFGSNLVGETTIADTLDGVGGVIDEPLPGFKRFYVNGSNAYFSSSTDGTWYFGQGRLIADYGTVGIYAGAAAAAVPEPLSLALLGAGLAGTAVVRRRRA